MVYHHTTTHTFPAHVVLYILLSTAGHTLAAHVVITTLQLTHSRPCGLSPHYDSYLPAHVVLYITILLARVLYSQ